MNIDQKTSEILNIAKKYVPSSEEGLSYGLPSLRLNGKPLIAVAVHKEHFSIYPFSPKVISGLGSLVEGKSVSKGTIRFDLNEIPSEELIKKIVALRSNEILS